LKLSDLRTFLDIIKAGSLTEAARQRGTSQPNLSRSLREIERRLDATLLRRDGRGVQLTPAGEVFRAFAEETLSRFQALRDEISGAGEGLPETVTLAVPMRTEHVFLPALLRVFADAAPAVTLLAREAFSEAALQDLSARRIDAMIGYLPPPPPLAGRVIAKEVFYAVGSPSFLGLDTTPISMAEVLALPLIVAGPDRYLNLLQQAAVGAGGELRPARFCSAADAMVAFAAEGEGVAILPYSNFQREAERGEVSYRQIVAPVVERSVFLNFRSGLAPRTCGTIGQLILSSAAMVKEKSRWSTAGAHVSLDLLR
jgi:LysR family nitrogen assimilation transcriptional regulator